MAFQAGNNVVIASSTNTTWDGTIRSSDIDDRAELLDNTVLNQVARGRQKGLEDWTMTVELQFETTKSYSTQLTPGTTVTVLTTIATGYSYQCAGVIESFRPRFVVDDIVKGPIVIRCNGTSIVRVAP